MEIPRFYHYPLQAGPVQLSSTEGHHFVNVLRGKAGQTIELFDGRGHLASGIVSQIKKADVLVEVKTITEFPPRESGRVILAAAVAKGQRFDWMLSKCTELGVDHIALVQYERSIRIGRESATERYQNLTIAACKQCGRVFLPVITGPQGLIETIPELKRRYPQSRFIFGRPDGDAETIRHLADSSKDTLVFVGPEGGLTEPEIQLLEHYGAAPIRIGNHILRTETAATAFAAILEALRINGE